MKLGFYQQLITQDLEARLRETLPSTVVARDALRNADAPDRLALHISRLVEIAVGRMDERERASRGLEMTQKLIELISAFIESPEFSEEAPVLGDSILEAIYKRNPDGSAHVINAPLIPLLDTTLLTNAAGEPRVGHQLQTEIESAQGVDLIMAFIRRSGIRPFLQDFKKHCDLSLPLRVLTTTYTNSTEIEALKDLVQIGADVRVSYDTSGTRLHAKAWLFHRAADVSTAYLGSSNLTHQAQRTGMEWNVRLSSSRNRPVVDKMKAVFNSYWESGDFVPFDAAQFSARTKSHASLGHTLLAPFEIRLYPFQERLLEKIAVSRRKGHHANLLVAATGTGKTVMAAIDYQRLADVLPRARLLFVAHSKEILDQSLVTFRHALRDGEFGELWVGGERPREWQHVFASVQSLSASGLDNLASDHFDVVIIDEVHHGAAQSYERVLSFLKPQELLGLTATPERADNLDILKWFGGRISAELRLWDAIDQGQLVPFDYYGVHDNSDLRGVGWRSGRGYDTTELTNVYTADEVWAKLVLSQVEKRVDDVARLSALGFCVSIEHAKFMARVFSKYGVSAKAIWGDTPPDERRSALAELRRGSIQVIFSVDLFNEGVDVPNVSTLLLLRPTESPVLFLQQLGRGLRKADGKLACTVLDFVGQHRREFRVHPKWQAFLGGSRRHVQKQVEGGFPFLPTGCHIELEPKAREIVLRSIRDAVPTQWPQKAMELRSLRAGHGDLTLKEFLELSGLELEDIYRNQRSWSDLQEAAGAPVESVGPEEKVLRRACGRLLHVNDARRIELYRELLSGPLPSRAADISTLESRAARMLIAQLCDKAVGRDSSLSTGVALLRQHQQVRSELIELLDVLEDGIDHLSQPVKSHPEAPLQVHGKYTRIEILAALDPQDRATTPPWREGVKWLPKAKTDVLLFTLDKTSGEFSPTTRYRDYAVSRNLIHWESQSTVRAASPTGQRYSNQVDSGTHVLLFARQRSDERAFWFLGPAHFVRAEGERPMAVTWRLETPLPGDLFAAFAAAVA
ncbi:MAG: DUF3427 domain-containing protein [Pseudomonadota bacterium]